MSTNDVTDAFDRHIDRLGKNSRTPAHLVDAAIYVRDTLEAAWLAALSVFGDRATPELALAIYKQIDGRRFDLADEERDQRPRPDADRRAQDRKVP